MSELKEHQFCESDEFFRESPGPLSNELHLYYLKSEADKVIADLEESHKKEVGQLLMKIVELKTEIESMKVKFREFNNNVCKKIVDASKTMSAISQDA
jgi:hypothetical protein